MPTRRLSVALPLLALCACGPASQVTDKAKPAAGSPCELADSKLRKHLGPELQAVTKRLPVFKPAEGEKPAAPLGCAVAYTLVPEELAEEGLGEEAGLSGSDQRLAFLTPDAKARWNLTLIDPSPQSPGPVDLELEARDLTADGVPEIVVRESALGADAYQGLRIFSVTLSEAGPRDLLSESLKLTTPENVQLFAEWKSGTAEGKRAVIFEAGGQHRIFTWNDGDKRFDFNEAATTAANPKPAPPPPSEPAPGSGAAPAAEAPGKIELP